MQQIVSAVLAELLGTALLVSAAVYTGSGVIVLVALGLAIVVGGPFSGGHFNPAITFMQALRHNISPLTATYYILSQLAGAVLSLYVPMLFMGVGYLGSKLF